MAAQGPVLDRLSEAGVSVWLDDLSRGRIDSGELRNLIEETGVRGVTTNPAIFAASVQRDPAYDAVIEACRSQNLGLTETITRLTTDDVRDACDLFATRFRESHGVDGWVSIEVEPELAHDTEGTILRAAELAARIDRPNVMIKIPATAAGLPAITATIAAGVSVNVTLIFSLSRYREVVNAYLTGLELAHQNGRDLSPIHSVASFFISRVDSAVDPVLDAHEDAEARGVRGLAGIANARVAYEIFTELFDSERARHLSLLGANRQRLLWASTGVKDPAYPATMYVAELVADQVVNTLPEATLNAVVADADATFPDTVSSGMSAAHLTLNDLERYGIDYRDLTDRLETEGLEKFAVAWNDMVETIRRRLDGEHGSAQ